MGANVLTAATLRAQRGSKERWISDGGRRGSGALWARLTHTGGWFYVGYKHQGKSVKVPLASYDPDGRRRLTLAQARDRAAQLGIVYRSGITDIRGYLQRERAAAQAEFEAAHAGELHELELAQRFSLEHLLALYVSHLEQQGKVSAANARYAFKHVPAELAQRLAACDD
jgi:hypothetical protein